MDLGWAGEKSLEQVGGLDFPPVAKELAHAQSFCPNVESQGKGSRCLKRSQELEFKMESDSIESDIK